MQSEGKTKQEENHIQEVTQRNYILKVIDAKAIEIRNALKSQGINVVALTEVFYEKIIPQEKGDSAS